MAKAITRGPHSVWPWQDYVPGAERALAVVLASLREPSEGMMKAADESFRQNLSTHFDRPVEFALIAWQAMLSRWAKENGVD